MLDCNTQADKYCNHIASINRSTCCSGGACGADGGCDHCRGQGQRAPHKSHFFIEYFQLRAIGQFPVLPGQKHTLLVIKIFQLRQGLLITQWLDQEVLSFFDQLEFFCCNLFIPG